MAPEAVDVLADAYARDVLTLPAVEAWLENVLNGSGRAFETVETTISFDVA